jgi:hypothetical protein
VQVLAPDQRLAAVGYAMIAQTVASSGDSNTAAGSGALAANTTGARETAFGFGALHSAVADSDNSAFGINALSSNNGGLINSAFGVSALGHNVTGEANVAVGYFALSKITTDNNIGIGADAGLNVTGGGDDIEIGNEGQAGDQDVIRLGASQTKTFIAGITGVPVTGSAVVVDGNGQLGMMGSSERFKRDIAPMDRGSERLLELQPVSFRYKPEIDPAGAPQFGLIAEEVEKIDPDLVVHDAQGKVFTVRYDAVNAMLLNEFLKEHRRAEQEQREVAQLKESVAEQRRQLLLMSEKLDALARTHRKQHTGAAAGE